MIAQTRPDIANVTEQTVLALKDLESRIGVLKGDLAALCQNLGHPEAARLAAAPSGAFGIPGVPSGPTANPWGIAVAPSPFGPGFAPYGQAQVAQFPNAGYAAPWGAVNPFWGAVGTPHGLTPFAGPSPYAAPWQNPAGAYVGSGWVQANAFSPFAAAGIPTAPPSPFAAIPAGYR